MKAHELQVGDTVSFEDAAYAYHGTIKYIVPYTEVFLDGKTCKVDGLQVTMTNGNSYYFLRDSDMDLYRLKMLLSNCPFCGAEEKTTRTN